jgi:hypothetical protein
MHLFSFLTGAALGATVGVLAVVGWSIHQEIERVTP